MITSLKKIIGCFLVLLVFISFVPNDDDPLEDLVRAMVKWTDGQPQEKVYLHMDKPYYALGDTIWFKAYVTTGSRHQLSAISGALYVDLINERDSVVSALKLPLTAGMSMGNFTLHDEIKEGNYRVRAYTQWMRNADIDYFFDHTFTVISPFENTVVAKANYSYSVINGKPLLNAILNYTTDSGAVLSKLKVTYEVLKRNETIITKTTETDDKGNILVIIPANKQQDWSGSVIKTIVELANRSKVEKQFPIKASLSESDIQFFPESGSLVYGVASKLAFKTVGIDGNGLLVKGEVVDQDQHHITDFVSGYAGIGSLLIRPEKGKLYTAKLTFPDGSLKSVALPNPIDNGYVLSVFQPNTDSILVRINVPEQMVNVQSAINVNCIVHSSGEIIAAAPLKIQKATTSFWMEKKAFPNGIAQFTIFSAEGEPLNERIAFIKTREQLSLTLKTPKRTYKSKELIDLQIEAKNNDNQPVAGNFSITVVDDSSMPYDESAASTIYSNLLLTSDIKGYVEKPNYYFSADNEEVNRALDNLMLTQGYRRFVWSNTMHSTPTSPKFKAEDLGTYISGKVITLGNKPAVNAAVTLMSIRANIFKSTTTDADGRFKFEGIFLADSLKFSIQARSQKKSSKVEVILDTVAKLHSNRNGSTGSLNIDLYRSTKAYADYGKKQDAFLEKSGGMSRTKRLEEVNITGKAYQKNLPKQRNFNLNGPGNYDQIIKNEDLQSCTNLMSCLQGRLNGVIFKDGLPFSSRASSTLNGGDAMTGAMLVVLNGVPLSQTQNSSTIEDIFLNSNPTPDQIASVEVLRSVNYTNKYGSDALNGVILITTNSGGNHASAYNPNIVNFSPKSFDKAKLFYTPRYDRVGSNIEYSDLRSTIYWNPGIKTNISGKTSLNFFAADGPANYKVTVEGIDSEGRLGRNVYMFSVSK